MTVIQWEGVGYAEIDVCVCMSYHLQFRLAGK